MTQPARRALLAAAGAAALLAAWVVPLLAIVTVWPLLLVVPGWAAMALLRPRIDLHWRIVLAVVLSVAGSTHLA